jgi:probable phosphoglycerate mutase
MVQTLYILRHGQAKHNLGDQEAHTFAGSSIDTDLDIKGLETANDLAEQLKDKDISMIICSGLKRSYQTAKIIHQILDLTTKIVVLPELNEFNIGDFAGHTEEEVKRLFPIQADNFYNGKVEEWSFPNGESYVQVAKRIERALFKIRPYNYENIVVVGHGIINRVIFYNFLKNQKNLWQERDYPHNRIVSIKIGEK